MKQYVCITLAILLQLGFANLAQAEDATPAALRKERENEMDAIKAKDQIQYEEARAREEFERKKVAVDQEILNKKKHIYDLKTQESEFAEQITQLKFQSAQLDNERNELQKIVDVTLSKEKIQAEAHAQSRTQLEAKKTQMNIAIIALNKTREETNRKISTYLIQMQQARAEIAAAETMIARSENDKARAEAEELQLRTQWASLSAQAESMREEKEKIMASMRDSQARLALARRDYQATKADTDKIVKEKVALEQEANRKKSEISSEMRRLEQDTSFAYTQKATAESEKVHIAAETANLQEKLIYTAKRNQESMQQLAESQGMLMESRLAFETAKADYANEASKGESAKLRSDAKMVKMRALASVVESSDMLDEQRPWVASKDCKITRTPANTQESHSKIHAGDRVMAATGPAGYVKILNTSGRPSFIPNECGKFAE